LLPTEAIVDFESRSQKGSIKEEKEEKVHYYHHDYNHHHPATPQLRPRGSRSQAIIITLPATGTYQPSSKEIFIEKVPFVSRGAREDGHVAGRNTRAITLFEEITWGAIQIATDTFRILSESVSRRERKQSGGNETVPTIEALILPQEDRDREETGQRARGAAVAASPPQNYRPFTIMTSRSIFGHV